MKNQKTILVTAYAVNPYKGSEDGMGWNFIRQIARFNKVIAITRQNNRPQIEKYMSENMDATYENIRFEYFDLPYWMRFWKKGSRGAMAYYWMWQAAMVPFIIKKQFHCDVVHNLNFHNDWTPSYLWKLNKPFVWGPVGHHPRIPVQYLKNYGVLARLKDILTYLLKWSSWKLSPALGKTVRKADITLCMNQSVTTKLKLKAGKHAIMPSVATSDPGKLHNDNKGFELISVGRLVPLKGFDLTIDAFAAFMSNRSASESADVSLKIFGSGPEKERLQEMAAASGCGEKIHFVEWIEREALLKHYAQASAFLFPSHEGAGMVVAEALSFGLPVICLNNSGPGEFINQHCGIAVDGGNYSETVNKLALGIEMLYTDKALRNKLSTGARERFETQFDWDRRGEQLAEIYQNL